MFGPYGQPGFNQPMYSTYPTMPAYPMQEQIGIQGTRFVSGVEEARSCVLPYGTKAILMDNDLPRFYLKEIDATGVATITTYEFHEVPDEQANPYVTKSEFEELKAMIAKLGGNNESTEATTAAGTANADAW